MDAIETIKKSILRILQIDSISIEKDHALTELLLSLDERMVAATSKHFVDYCRLYLYPGEWDRKYLYNRFVNLYPGQINLSVKTFCEWLRIYCAFNFQSFTERKTNGKYMIIIT